MLRGLKLATELRNAKKQKQMKAERHFAKATYARVWKCLQKNQRLATTEDAVLQRMAALFEREVARKALDQVHSFSILMSFGSSEKLNDKLLKIQFLKYWIRYAQQDKKTLKLMGKAIKHYNRVQKGKIWRAWLTCGLNTEIYQRYSDKLQKLAILSLKKWVTKQKVKKIKEEKYTQYRRVKLMQYGFAMFIKSIEALRPINEAKRA